MDKSDPAYGETVRDLRLKARDLLRGCYALRGFQTPQSEEALETAKQLCRHLNYRPDGLAKRTDDLRAQLDLLKNSCESDAPSPQGCDPRLGPKTSELTATSLPGVGPGSLAFPRSACKGRSGRRERPPSSPAVPSELRGSTYVSSPLLMVGVATMSAIAIAAIRRRRHFSRSSQVTGSGEVGGGGARQMPELDSS